LDAPGKIDIFIECATKEFFFRYCKEFGRKTQLLRDYTIRGLDETGSRIVQGGLQTPAFAQLWRGKRA